MSKLTLAYAAPMLRIAVANGLGEIMQVDDVTAGQAHVIAVANAALTLRGKAQSGGKIRPRRCWQFHAMNLVVA